MRTIPNDKVQPEVCNIQQSIQQNTWSIKMLKQTPILNINLEIVWDGGTTTHNTLCTRLQAGYQINELGGYSAKGQDSPVYIRFI